MLDAIGWMSLAVLLSAPAAAQQHDAHIRGTVLNPDGTAAPNVALTIVKEAGGLQRRLSSDDHGHYVIPSLAPGTYLISTDDGVEPGLRVRTAVSAGQILELTLRLGLTSITADADVRPSFVEISRQSATRTTRVHPVFITKLPLDGRNVLDLVLLAPGVLPGEVAIAGNGTSDRFTSYCVDGLYNTEPLLGTPAARVQIDAIQELAIHTSSVDAHTGRTAGTQIHVVTASGTDRFRGGAVALYAPSPDRLQLAGFGGGPLAADRTFLFANYELTEGSEDFRGGAGHLVSARADHRLTRSSRLTARYALDDGRLFDRRGQHAGVSIDSALGATLTNDLSLAFSRVAFGDLADDIAIAESENYQVRNVTTWGTRGHLLNAGVNWSGLEHGLSAVEISDSTWGVFIQDDWRALPNLSINAGVRFDQVSPEGGDRSGEVSPRLGAAWTIDGTRRTVLRGGYGIYRNIAAIDPVIPRVDGWSLGVQRQIGRKRTVGAAYVGTRGDDLRGGLGQSRYDALQIDIEQRAELGITALVAYTYGRWRERIGDDDEPLRAPLDSRQRLSAAFVASLPFGDERRWFDDGVLETIFANMELSGILTLQGGGRVPGTLDRQGPGHRNLDLALLKHIAVGDQHLQLRFETFNVTDRENLGRGRRYQMGAKIGF